MNRRKFVFASTISMLVIIAAIAGLAFYANFSASASVQGMPAAIRYFPADTQAIFGINVRKFVESPVYTQIMQKHEQEIGKDLAEFTAKTGVDPRRDVDYIIGAGRAAQQKGSGAVIAVGRFDRGAIISFINSKSKPISVDYNGTTVLMIPEGSKLQKGIAFLDDSEVVLGDLDSLHSVLDVRHGKAAGITRNAILGNLLAKVGSEEMFWFAGDASVLSKVPGNTPYMPNLSVVQSVFGTLNLGTTIHGKVSVTAKDETAAKQLADFARGLVALGNLASAQNPELAVLAQGIQVMQAANQFDVSMTLPFDVLVKLDAAKTHMIK